MGLDAQQAVEILRVLNELKYPVIFIVIATLALGFSLWRWFNYRDKRAEARERAEADARADATARRESEVRTARDAATTQHLNQVSISMRTMRQAFENHTALEERSSSRLLDHLGRLDDTLNEVTRCMREVRDRQAGVINREDSLRIITHSLQGFVKSELVRLFEYSIRKNDYSNRANLIKERVKTEAATAVANAERDLHGYKLGLDLRHFFPRRGGKAGRFVLVDDAWEQVVRRGLYEHEAPVEQRVKAMEVLVHNLVTDLIARATERSADLYNSASDDDEDDSGSYEAPRT